MSLELEIGGKSIPPGLRTTIEVPLPPLYTHTPMVMPAHVVRGQREGPILLLSAAIHGDELNGIEIIRRVLQLPSISRIKGSIIAVPVVNVYGFIHWSRHLPDRRDLNRSFPGSDKGSLAARLADIFLTELVTKCTHGVDLQTGAIHRSNLPQIRANLDDMVTLEMAKAFGTPVVLNSNLRDGSLREAADSRGVKMLLYESGEALRFDEISIRGGVRGVINIMRHLEMLPRSKRKSQAKPVIARSSKWLRATASGLLKTLKPLGASVNRGELLALIDDPLGDNQAELKAEFSGIIIGRTEIPLVHEGEAIFHIARFDDIKEAENHVESFQTEHAPVDLTINQQHEEPPIV